MGFLSNIFDKKVEANASVVFIVSMSCGKCVQRVEELMAKNKAVVSTDINIDAKTVSLTYDKNKTDENKLKTDIEALGFDVERN